MMLRFHESLWRHRDLWWRLTEREVLGRYRGSLLGVGWTVLQPLAMLVVYTFVFSQVFRARWGSLEGAGPLGFAINLFAGLIVFNLFSECASRAPMLVTGQPNYVKKVVFPLEILSAVSVGNAIFHALASLVVLLVAVLVVFRGLPASLLWLPLVWLPLLLGSLAMSWLLAALGVFLRDIGQLVGVLLNMLMFLSPIFFPLSALPPRWLPLLQLNPLAHVIEQTRRVVVAGEAPEALYLLVGSAASLLACELSFRLFRRAKPAFADVL
jgi:lipopolysaccharide transport system permease protein